MTWNIKGNNTRYNGNVKQNWFVMLSIDGFESVMLVYGTQTEMWNYMRDSFSRPIQYRYRIASDDEVTTAKRLGIKAYIC